MALPQRYIPSLNAGLLQDKDHYTEDEYFAFEERAIGRWEFVPINTTSIHDRELGIIRAMSGGTPNHSAIAMNLGVALTIALRGIGNQTCRTYGSDLKIHTATGANTYPDVSVVCGSLSFHNARTDIVTNPILVAEVLSPSTEAYDRGDKWQSYRSIPGLQHALFISTTQPHIELYTRQEQGWHFESIETGVVSLSELGITFPLSEVYALIDFSSRES